MKVFFFRYVKFEKSTSSEKSQRLTFTLQQDRVFINKKNAIITFPTKPVTPVMKTDFPAQKSAMDTGAFTEWTDFDSSLLVN